MSIRKRSYVSLLTAFSFVVLAVSGIVAFVLPFSLRVVGLHALMGFVFIGVIALHVANNFNHLARYARTSVLWTTLAITSLLTALFVWQPGPIQDILGLSQNLGPAIDRFEVHDEGWEYRYAPAENYQLTLIIRAGEAFDADHPPHVAIWLENASFYHIETLHAPDDLPEEETALPYYAFKLRGWEEAKRKAEAAGRNLSQQAEVDGLSSATENSSFDPADYIVPADSDDSLPYRLVIEINQPGDDQPSLVYAVEIDNASPKAFQVLDLVGYPQQEENDAEGKQQWSLYFVDERFDSALELVDSALLTIDRDKVAER